VPKEALLIISASFDQATLKSTDLIPPSITVWDSKILDALLEKHVRVKRQFEELIQVQRQAESLIAGTVALPEDAGVQFRLIERVNGVEHGRPGWRAYEDICIKILNCTFLPPLRTPLIQSRSEDDLNRRDAIYPIGNGNAFWESIKYDFSSRLVG
jgi:hypothetical protein